MFFFCNDIIEPEDKLIKNNHYSVFLQWQVSSYLSVLITELFHIYQSMTKRGIRSNNNHTKYNTKVTLAIMQTLCLTS